MKAAVVYWSATGNTKKMAEAVAAGAEGKGAEVSIFKAPEFNSAKTDEFDSIAFGCPAMGNEELEYSIFEPMFNDVEGKLKDKKVALFGSYGWGKGIWMRSWEERCKNNGINLVRDSVISYGEPDEDGVKACKALGEALI